MIDCTLCGDHAWQGPGCSECDQYKNAHYTEGTGANIKSDPAAYFCIAESPDVTGVSGKLNVHQGWSFDIEKTIKRAFATHKGEIDQTLMGLTGRYTYAMRCSKEKPVKKDILACAPLVHAELLEYAVKDKPIMVFALGEKVLTSLGIAVKKYRSFQGRFTKTMLGDREVIIYASLSKRQLVAKPGHIEILKKHMMVFMDAVHAISKGKDIRTRTEIATLTAKYHFPKSVSALRKLVEYITEYTSGGFDADKLPLAIDTETNTVNPHRDKLKILSFVVSWAPGEAASIPLEHPQSYFTFEEAAPYVQRILDCAKPKILHNAKFDLKVLWRKGWKVRNFAWDTMLAEHLLEEDKKGYYSLKELTRVMLPDYADYEEDIDTFMTELKAKKAKKETARLKKLNRPLPPKLKGAAAKLADDGGYEEVPLRILNPYGAIDADVTRRIAIIQQARMKQEQKDQRKLRDELRKNPYATKYILTRTAPTDKPLPNLMREQLTSASEVLGNMELVGMPVDKDYIEELVVELDRSITLSKIQLSTMIPSYVFEEFNPSSNPQLRKLLYGTGYIHPETGATVCYKDIVEPPTTAKGAISTNAAFLKQLVNQNDCVFSKELLIFRAMSKARNTFVENIKVLSEEDGRMHTSFHIAGTSTGRLSSSNENMQNVPKQIGKHNIKKIFVPSDRENNIILNADAKAAEVRIYAAYSKDKNLIEALNNGMDPHSFFASMVYAPEKVLANVPPSDYKTVMDTIGIDSVHAWSYDDFQNRSDFIGSNKNPGPDPTYGKQLNKLRTNIKRVVFGILYGASKYKISSIVGISEEQGAAIISSLFTMFPSIPEYIKRTHEQLNHLKMVETFFGRRRRFDTAGMPFKMKNKAQRQAVNFKIQSTSSEIVIRVMNDIAEPIKHDFNGQLMITVHDSVVGEIPKKYISQMPAFMEEYGVNRVRKLYDWLPVPFQWDVEVGPSYGELSPVDRYLENDSSVVQEEVVGALDFLDQEIKSELAQSV